MKPQSDSQTSTGFRPRTSFTPISFSLCDGQACTIRAATEDDAEEFLRFLPQSQRESDFLAWMAGEFHLTVEQEREYLREREQEGSVVLCATLDGRIIASAGMLRPKLRRNTHHAEFGITIAQEFWGLGLGRKMTECILECGRQIGLCKMTLRVFADNHRAIALYRSLGFIEEGRLVQDVLRADGSYTDTVVMARFYERG